jgi:hypothetical protein
MSLCVVSWLAYPAWSHRFYALHIAACLCALIMQLLVVYSRALDQQSSKFFAVFFLVMMAWLLVLRRCSSKYVEYASKGKTSACWRLKAV